MEEQKLEERSEQVTTPPAKVVKVKSGRFPIIWIVVLILVGALLAVGVLLAAPKVKDVYNDITGKNNEQNDNAKEDDTDTEIEEEEEKEPDVMKFFFHSYVTPTSNVSSFNITAMTDSKETSLAAETSLRSLSAIDEDVVGFLACKTVAGDFGCGLYIYNTATNTYALSKKLGVSQFGDQSDFLNTTTYAYTYSDNVAKKWKLILVKGAVTKELESIADNQAYGRGGFDEDASNLRFSPDGKYLLQIGTSSPRATMDFNIYLYDTTSYAKTKIASATQPEWIDNTKFVYRKYSNNGLYIYDVVAQTSTKIAKVQSDAFNPSVYNGTNIIAYEDESSHEVWTYNITTDTAGKLIDNANYPVFVSPNYIVFNEVEDCVNGSDDCPMSDYKILSTKIYNMTTGVSTQIDVNNSYEIYEGVIER